MFKYITKLQIAALVCFLLTKVHGCAAAVGIMSCFVSPQMFPLALAALILAICFLVMTFTFAGIDMARQYKGEEDGIGHSCTSSSGA